MNIGNSGHSSARRNTEWITASARSQYVSLPSSPDEISSVTRSPAARRQASSSASFVGKYRSVCLRILHAEAIRSRPGLLYPSRPNADRLLDERVPPLLAAVRLRRPTARQRPGRTPRRSAATPPHRHVGRCPCRRIGREPSQHAEPRGAGGTGDLRVSLLPRRRASTTTCGPRRTARRSRAASGARGPGATRPRAGSTPRRTGRGSGGRPLLGHDRPFGTATRRRSRSGRPASASRSPGVPSRGGTVGPTRRSSAPSGNTTRFQPSRISSFAFAAARSLPPRSIGNPLHDERRERRAPPDVEEVALAAAVAVLSRHVCGSVEDQRRVQVVRVVADEHHRRAQLVQVVEPEHLRRRLVPRSASWRRRGSRPAPCGRPQGGPVRRERPAARRAP